MYTWGTLVHHRTKIQRLIDGVRFLEDQVRVFLALDLVHLLDDLLQSEVTREAAYADSPVWEDDDLAIAFVAVFVEILVLVAWTGRDGMMLFAVLVVAVALVGNFR